MGIESLFTADPLFAGCRSILLSLLLVGAVILLAAIGSRFLAVFSKKKCRRSLARHSRRRQVIRNLDDVSIADLGGRSKKSSCTSSSDGDRESPGSSRGRSGCSLSYPQSQWAAFWRVSASLLGRKVCDPRSCLAFPEDDPTTAVYMKGLFRVLLHHSPAAIPVSADAIAFLHTPDDFFNALLRTN